MATQKQINFEFVHKDTCDVTPFTVTEGGVAVSITDVAIDMDDALTGEVAQEFRVGTGLTITDGPAGEFSWGGVLITAPPGKYNYDIELTLTGGRIKAWIKGKVRVLVKRTKVP